MIEVLRSRHLSLGPRVPAFEQAFAARVGAPHASAVSSGTAALHLALRAVGRDRGRRGDHVAVLVRRVRQRGAVRAGAAGVRGHRPGDAEPRRRRRRGGDHLAHDRPAAGAHLRLPRRHARAGARTGCRSSRTRARRSARCTRTASPVGGRGHPAAFGFYANKQLTTGEGGMLTMGSAEHKERVDSERNQGRAPDMGWLDHDRLGFNYRLTDIACALGLVQLDAAGRDARRPGPRRWLVPRGAGGRRGAGAPVRGLRRRRARVVRVRRPAPARRRPRRHDPRAAASAACSPSPTCPRST